MTEDKSNSAGSVKVGEKETTISVKVTIQITMSNEVLKTSRRSEIVTMATNRVRQELASNVASGLKNELDKHNVGRKI